MSQLSLDDFFKKIIHSFTKWRVLPHPHFDLEKADAIVALSFGVRNNDAGEANRALALVAQELHTKLQLPVIAQWEIGDNISIDARQLVHIVRKPRLEENGYLDTYEVLTQAAEVAHSRGWRKIIIIAHSDHAWRAIKVAQRLGFEPMFSHLSTDVYDKNSSQKHTRSRWRFILREIPARIYYIFKGWM